MVKKLKNSSGIKIAVIFSLVALGILFLSFATAFAQNASTNSTNNTLVVTTTTNPNVTVREGVLVKPAKLGIYRITVPLFSDYVTTKSFLVGNAYSVPINVSLSAFGNISNITQLSDTDFVLQPGENKTIYYTLTIADAGLYGDGVQITAKVAGRASFIGYQADLYVFAVKSQVPEILYIVIGVIILLAALVAVKKFKFKFAGSGRNERSARKLKIMFALFVAFAVMGGIAHAASAKSVAMIVKNANNLDPTHEQRIYDILKGMGLDITLVDKNVGVNYNNYDLIVVAGRPLGGGMLDSFVANVPVNSRPTIAIDFSYPDNWGWVKGLGTSSLSSSSVQKVYPQIAHPLTYGYNIGQLVYVHLISGYTVINLVQTQTNLTTVATADSGGNLPIIAYANPNTQLANGNKVANNAAIVFFGVTYPNLWTGDAVNLFQDSVNWLLNLDFSTPSTPQLSYTSPATSGFSNGNINWQWTASNSTSGILYYEFQLSNSPTFSTIIYNTTTTNLNVATNGLIDTHTYYARVRAWDSLNIYSNWSNVVNLTVDTSSLIINITSPASGATINYGSAVAVNATIKTPNRMASTGGTCSVNISDTFAGTIPFDHASNTCSGSVTAPTLQSQGPANLVVSATNSLGNTNSSTLSIYYNGQIPSAPSPSSSSSGSGSGGFDTSITAAILFVQAPTQLTGYENQDLSFIVNVKNIGDIDVQDVKVTVQKMTMAAPDVNPVIFSDLPSGQTQNFTVTLHIPQPSVGTYQFTVKVLAYGASITKRITLNVLPEIKQPVLSIVSTDMPQAFVAGQQTTVNSTIANTGNEIAYSTIHLDVPSGWSASQNDQNVNIAIDISSQQTIVFHVTPDASSGQLTVSASYEANGQQQTATQSYDVNATSAGTGGLLTALTAGIVSVLSQPQIFIPTAILAVGVVAAIATYATMTGADLLGLFKGVKGMNTGTLKRLPQQISNTLSSSAASASSKASKFFSSLQSSPSARYVWPRGGKGFSFNYLFGGAAATGAATAAAATSRAARTTRTTQPRATVKDAMFDKWETRNHPSVHSKARKKA